MVQFSTEHRVFMVRKYFESKSFVAVIEAFRNHFPDKDPPSKSTIFRNVDKYSRDGTSLNLNKQRSGRPRTVRTQENIEVVRQTLAENPTLSTRRNPFNITQSSVTRIIKCDLRWHPYKIHLRHELKEQDFGRRVRFCNWFIAQCQNNRFLRNLIISDEASFSMGGKVSSQNVRHYAPKGEHPSFNYDVNCSREKLTVWVGLCGNGTLLGPFFFERNVTGRAYLNMIEENIIPSLLRAYGLLNEEEIRNIWWAQDGAPAHRTRNVRACLTRLFRQNVIGIGHAVEWPPRSPDLTPLDFFCWGYLKSKVYLTPPQDIEQLRERIIQECNVLTRQNFIVNSIRSMRRKANICVARNGGHVEGF